MPNLSDQTWKNDCTWLITPSCDCPSTQVSFKYQVGRLDSELPAAIRLSGDHILEEHCYFENIDGRVVIICMPDSVTVRRLSLFSIYHLRMYIVFKRKTDSARTGTLLFR
jgi:hypothetical protein